MSVISKQNKQNLASLIDNWTVYKNPFLEGIDGWVYGIVIGALDDNFLQKVKPQYHERIDQAIGFFANEQFEEAAVIIGSILAEAVETPLVDGTPAEIELYEQALKLFAQLIQSWLEKKQ